MGMQVEFLTLAKAGTKAPEQTLEEPRYLRGLIDKQATIQIRLTDNQVVRGVLEYYDSAFLRLTRVGQPNLFIYKDKIKYMTEEAE